MDKRKSINDILWQVDEPTYREDPSFHYSMLKDFAKDGRTYVQQLKTGNIEDKKSKSLIFGSLVDAMLTDPNKLSEFEKVSDEDIIKLTPTEKKVADYIIEGNKNCPEYIDDDDEVMMDFDCLDAYSSLKRDTVIKKHVPNVRAYIKRYYESKSSKLKVSEEDFIDACECKEAILGSTMRKYFKAQEFEDDIERVFQAKLKWMDPKTGISYRVMFDSLYVDHTHKTIQPNDLKTTSTYEDEFYRTFLFWNYDIQARLYSKVLREVISKDEYFKNFTILPFQFLVVSRHTKTPIIWRYDDYLKPGDLIYQKIDGSRVILRDPLTLASELRYCLERVNPIKNGISLISANSIEYWIENGN